MYLQEVPRFALLEGTIEDFIDEQENKTMSKNRRRRKPAKTLSANLGRLSSLSEEKIEMITWPFTTAVENSPRLAQQF